MERPVAVRHARAEDAQGLADLLNEIISRGGTTAYEEPFTPEHLADAMLTGPNVFSCFVAVENNGELIGFQTLVKADYLPDDVGDIATFTRIDRVQQGTGTHLFAATRKAAEGWSLSAINATIRADNVGGLAFYSRLGFVDHQVYRAIPLADGMLVDRISKRFSLTIGHRATV